MLYRTLSSRQESYWHQVSHWKDNQVRQEFTPSFQVIPTLATPLIRLSTFGKTTYRNTCVTPKSPVGQTYYSPRGHTETLKVTPKVGKTFVFAKTLHRVSHVMPRTFYYRRDQHLSPRLHTEVSRLCRAHLLLGVMSNASHTVSETNARRQDFIAKPSSHTDVFHCWRENQPSERLLPDAW